MRYEIAINFFFFLKTKVEIFYTHLNQVKFQNMRSCSKLPYKLCGRSFQKYFWPLIVIVQTLTVDMQYTGLQIITAPCEEWSLSVYKPDKKRMFFLK